MRAGSRTRALIVLTALACATASLVGVPASSAARPHVLYVSAKAKKKNKRCTKKAPCRTIARAIRIAHPGNEILVLRGTYREQVNVAKRVTLVGSGKPTIDATGHVNGVLIAGPSAAKAVVRGFVVQNASEEGILDRGVGFVTISGNTVRANDKGLSVVPPAGQCAPQGPVPGDCGEGLHLMGASNVTVEGNTVTANAGGILLTDEIGPTAHNTVAKNTVIGNVLDCGITLAGHNPKAVTLAATPGPPTVAGVAPTVGGIYDNVIENNTVNGNGVKGLGAGIGLFGGAPGTAVYNNSVLDNTAEGNGLGGVTLHSHAPGQDLSGNTISGNILSGDGIAGYPNGAPGDEDVGLKETAGIILFSAATKLTSTTVEHNQISNEQIGIWTQNAPLIPRTANTFASTVKTGLVQK
jgi:parallel beta-helix repeat protein